MVSKSLTNKKTLSMNGKKYTYYDISSLEQAGWDISRLPYTLRILLECALRNYDGKLVTKEHIERIASWSGKGTDKDHTPRFYRCPCSGGHGSNEAKDG